VFEIKKKYVTIKERIGIKDMIITYYRYTNLDKKKLLGFLNGKRIISDAE